MIHAIRSWPVRMAIFAGLIGLSAAARQRLSKRPAHRRRPGPGRLFIVQRLRRAISQLDLTDDQKAQVKAIFDQASQQAQELSQSLEDYLRIRAVSEDRRIRQGASPAIGAVLTEEQMSLFQRNLGPGPTSRPGGDNVAGGMVAESPAGVAKVDLSPEQQQQIKDLIDSALQKARELRDKAAAGQDVQAQMQQLRQDLRSKLQSILSPIKCKR